jgi:hypothetical protein
VRSSRLTLLAVALAATGCDPETSRQQQPASQQQPQPATTGLPASANQPGVTPMNERVAVIGFLNKRNGIVRDITMRPGQAVRVKDAVVRLRACEATPPWEFDKLTGAFVQLDVQRTDQRWQRVFSGWLYKESPSLNTVEHPVYDVWPKSCAMTYPSGAEAPAAPDASSNRSRASRSAPATAARPRPRPGAADEPAATPAPAPEPPPSAADSNAT